MVPRHYAYGRVLLRCDTGAGTCCRQGYADMRECAGGEVREHAVPVGQGCRRDQISDGQTQLQVGVDIRSAAVVCDHGRGSVGTVAGIASGDGLHGYAVTLPGDDRRYRVPDPGPAGRYDRREPESADGRDLCRLRPMVQGIQQHTASLGHLGKTSPDVFDGITDPGREWGTLQEISGCLRVGRFAVSLRVSPFGGWRCLQFGHR